MSGETELATFGAGCFWGVEARFREMEGVVEATSGTVEVDYIMVAPKGLHTWNCDCELNNWTFVQYITESVANNIADMM